MYPQSDYRFDPRYIETITALLKTGLIRIDFGTSPEDMLEEVLGETLIHLKGLNVETRMVCAEIIREKFFDVRPKMSDHHLQRLTTALANFVQ